MPVKYIAKKMIEVNDNLRIYQYFYPTHIDIYYTPKNSQEDVIKVQISLPHTDLMCEVTSIQIAEVNGYRKGVEVA